MRVVTADTVSGGMMLPAGGGAGACLDERAQGTSRGDEARSTGIQQTKSDFSFFLHEWVDFDDRTWACLFVVLE